MPVGCAVPVHARKDGLEVILGAPAQPAGQGFVTLPLALISPENFVDVEMDFLVRDFGLDQCVELGVRPRLSSQEHVEVLLFDPIHRAGGATETDIRRLMLAAGAGASAEMNPDLVLVMAADLLELADQPDHPILGLADGQVAKLNARAGDAPLAEVAWFNDQAGRLEILLERGHVLLWHVGDN